MKPLIFSFLTASDNAMAVDESILEYDKDLQLSIVKETKQPAFDHLNLRTMTDTKTADEGSDSDRSLDHSFPTVGKTKLINDLSILLSTKTITLSVEVSDEDHGPKMAKLMLGTMTMTRTNMEASDSDKQ